MFARRLYFLSFPFRPKVQGGAFLLDPSPCELSGVICGDRRDIEVPSNSVLKELCSRRHSGGTVRPTLEGGDNFVLSLILLERTGVKEEFVAHDKAVFEGYQGSRPAMSVAHDMSG